MSVEMKKKPFKDHIYHRIYVHIIFSSKFSEKIVKKNFTFPVPPYGETIAISNVFAKNNVCSLKVSYKALRDGLVSDRFAL
jgi:hypothetical protein